MATGDQLPPLPPYPGRVSTVLVDVLLSESGCFGDEHGKGGCDAKMVPGDLVYMVYRADRLPVRTNGPALMRCERHAMAIMAKHQDELRAWLKENGR